MKDSGIEWIGQIPDDWKIVPLTNVFSFGKGLPITKENLVETGIPVISYGQIHGKYNSGTSLINSLFRYVNESYLKTNPNCLVHKNDVIFADTSEDLDGCGNAVFVNQEMQLFAGYHTVILFSKSLESNKYYTYLFKTDAWRSQIRAGLVEVKLYSVSRKVLKKTLLIVPPINKRNRIADFLDKKCAEIDTVVSKTQQSIEEYKKLKQAVITQAVTKGIRPNRQLKDSGIDWIGQIPSDWNVRRIKTLFKLRNEKNFSPLSEVNLISLYTDKGVVQHSDIEYVSGNKASNADGYNCVYEDDIIVNIILCWMGAMGRSSYTGVTSPAYDVYAPKEETYSKFYHYYFRTKGFNGECFQRGKGIMLMRWRTYSEDFTDIYVCNPSLEEQQEIAEYLDKKCAKIDTLIEKKQQLVLELENYKKSLIYEYVTGKKEVV